MSSVFWIFYQLAAGIVLLAAGPFLLARRGGHYLPTLSGRLGRARGPAPAPGALWIHAVSVGEVGVAAALARALPPEIPPAGDHRHPHGTGAGPQGLRRPRRSGLPAVRPRLRRPPLLPPPPAARPDPGRGGLLAPGAPRGPPPESPHRRGQRPRGRPQLPPDAPPAAPPRSPVRRRRPLRGAEWRGPRPPGGPGGRPRPGGRHRQPQVRVPRAGAQPRARRGPDRAGRRPAHPP